MLVRLMNKRQQKRRPANIKVIHLIGTLQIALNVKISNTEPCPKKDASYDASYPATIYIFLWLKQRRTCKCPINCICHARSAHITLRWCPRHSLNWKFSCVQDFQRIPSLINVMISEKPILRQTWSQDCLWPQCAFKKSMLKVSCNSH